MKNADEKNLIEKLRQYSTPELCDGMTEPRVMDYGIKPMVTTKKIVGRACTIKVPKGVSGYIPEVLKEVNPGEILVIAGGGECNHSYWGDHRSICAKIQQVEGVIIDGAFRDIEGCREAGVPIYARAVIPRSCKKDSIGEKNVPVECGGIIVNPGDYIVGDENGICVIRPEELEEVFEKSDRKILAQKKTIEYMEETGILMPRVDYSLLE